MEHTKILGDFLGANCGITFLAIVVLLFSTTFELTFLFFHFCSFIGLILSRVSYLLISGKL